MCHLVQWEEHLILSAVPSQESRGKYVLNIKPEISNFWEDPAVIAGDADVIYAACILHNYVRDQGLDLNDIAHSANFQNNLRNIRNEGWPNKVHSKQETNLNSPSRYMYWQNERVKRQVNLYAVKVDVSPENCLKLWWK